MPWRPSARAEGVRYSCRRLLNPSITIGKRLQHAQTREANLRNVFLNYFLRLAALQLSSGLLLAQETERGPLSELDWLERDMLIRAVVAHNPTIESARQAWEAAREREPQLSSLDDPTISYGFAPPSIFAGDVRYGQRIGFAQRLPYPGKRSLRGEIARAEADAAGHDYEAVRLQLATMASLLFDDYYFVARALEINTEHIGLLEDFKRIATARYASGLAAQQDPLQAEVEVAHVLHRALVLRTRQRTIVAQLNALLHRAPDASLPPPPSELTAPDITERADESLVERPELEARLAEIGAREAEVRLREKEFYPDFEATTSFNSMWGDWEYRWTVGIGINIPIRRDRLRAASAEAAAALKQAESAHTALEDRIRMEVYVARERWLETEHVAELFRSRLLPASADQIRAARVGFETGQNSFLELIEAERNQRSVQLGYEQAITDGYRRRAELDRALGRIPALSIEEETASGRTAPRGKAFEGGMQ